MEKCKRCGGSGREPDPVSIGQKMRQLREERGLTLRAVARKLGFSPAYVSDLELGRRGWSAMLQKRYLDVVFLGLAALTLALAPLASAEPPNAYTYTRVIVDTPQSCVSPCSVTLTFTLPGPALMQPPYLKDCRYWAHRGYPERWDGVPVELDHHVGLVQGPSVLAQGVYTWVLSDAHPGGRAQRMCARFVFVPLSRLYEAMEAEEE